MILAAGLGFEPKSPAPEAGVLPLHHPAIPFILANFCAILKSQNFLYFFNEELKGESSGG